MTRQTSKGTCTLRREENRPCQQVAKVLHFLQSCHLLSTERINNYKAGLCMNYALRTGLWQYTVLMAEKIEK